MRINQTERKSSSSLAVVLISVLVALPKISSFTTSPLLLPKKTNKPCRSCVDVGVISGVKPLAAKFVQWKQKSSSSSQQWQLQTAVTSYQRNGTLLELHSMVHYGSQGYFDFYNHLNDSTAVVYELLVDEKLLEDTSRIDEKDEDGLVLVPQQLSRLRQPVDASVSDRQTAQAYGLTCQASVIDYCRSNFFHGDWTRQELLKAIDNNDSKGKRFKQQQPLWQQASGWMAGQEAATALLVGPPLLWVNNKQLRQALSSSTSSSSTAMYFRQVVHSRAIQLLRPLLWLTVPSPEISILLLDWSSYGVAADWTLGSPLSRAVLKSLAAGDWDATRKLVFGQVVVTTTSTSSNNNANTKNSQDDWITQRNQRAIDVVNQVKDHSKKIVVLYGCLHCDDLQQRLVDVGFEPVERRWRTAWSVPVPTMTATRLLDPNLLKLMFLLVAYLGIGALDWIATWADVTHSYAEASRTLELTSEAVPSVLGDYALYLTRHLFIYIGLSKFVWNTKQS